MSHKSEPYKTIECYKHHKLLALKMPYADITAAVSVGMMVYIGLSNGTILVYEVKEEQGSLSSLTPHKCRGAESAAQQSRRGIKQMVAISDLDLLLCLIDGAIHTYKLSSLEPIERDVIGDGQKGSGDPPPRINAFIAKKQDGEFYIAATTRGNKLCTLKYSNEGGRISFEKTGRSMELSFPESTKSLSWIGQSGVCVGLSKEYSYCDYNRGECQQGPPTGKHFRTPMTCNLVAHNKVEMLFTQDCAAAIVKGVARPDRSWGIGFTEFPTGLCGVHPWVLSYSASHIELHSVEVRRLRQTINIPNVTIISHNAFCDFDVGASLQDGDGGDGYDDSSLKVEQLLPPVLICITKNSEFYTLDPVRPDVQVDQLVHAQDFHSALTLCTKMPPGSVTTERMNLVHLLCGYTKLAELEPRREANAVRDFLASACDPRTVIMLFDGFLSGRWTRPEPARYREELDSAFESARRATAEAGERGINVLTTYLRSTRRAQDDAESVDTAYYLALCVARKGDAVDFLKDQNRVNVDHCKEFLSQRKAWPELVVLLSSKGLHQDSLRLLRDLGQDRAKCGGAYDPLDSTIKYVQQLGDSQGSIVFELADWVLGSAQEGPRMERILDMFCHSGAILSPPQVLRHLKGKRPEQVGLRVRYLERVVLDAVHGEREDTKTQSMHMDLILAYLKLLESEKRQERFLDISERLQRFLRTSTMYDAASVEGRVAHLEGVELSIVKARLEKHTEALNILVYRLNCVERALEYCRNEYREGLPAGWLALQRGEGFVQQSNIRSVRTQADRGEAVTETDIYAEPNLSARVLDRARRGHVFLLAVTEKRRQDVYFELFRVCLQPDESGVEPKVEWALRVLNEFRARVDPIRALRLLPRDLPVSVLAPWLSEVLASSSIAAKDRAITAGLCESEHLKVQAQYVKWRRKKVVIGVDQTCKICVKRLTMNKALMCLPSGAVVHSGCLQQSRELGGPNLDPTPSPLDYMFYPR